MQSSLNCPIFVGEYFVGYYVGIVVEIDDVADAAVVGVAGGDDVVDVEEDHVEILDYLAVGNYWNETAD